MEAYRVTFFKNVMSSDGHQFAARSASLTFGAQSRASAPSGPHIAGVLEQRMCVIGVTVPIVSSGSRCLGGPERTDPNQTQRWRYVHYTA